MKKTKDEIEARLSSLLDLLTERPPALVVSDEDYRTLFTGADPFWVPSDGSSIHKWSSTWITSVPLYSRYQWSVKREAANQLRNRAQCRACSEEPPKKEAHDTHHIAELLNKQMEKRGNLNHVLHIVAGEQAYASLMSEKLTDRRLCLSGRDLSYFYDRYNIPVRMDPALVGIELILEEDRQ